MTSTRPSHKIASRWRLLFLGAIVIAGLVAVAGPIAQAYRDHDRRHYRKEIPLPEMRVVFQNATEVRVFYHGPGSRYSPEEQEVPSESASLLHQTAVFHKGGMPQIPFDFEIFVEYKGQRHGDFFQPPFYRYCSETGILRSEWDRTAWAVAPPEFQAMMRKVLLRVQQHTHR